VKEIPLRTAFYLGTALLIVVTLGNQFSIAAQGSGLPNANVSSSGEKGVPEDDQGPNSLTEELRAKRAIKEAEKDYKQHLDRARELSDLGKDLDESFHKKKLIDSDDNKKLARLEKLTRRIRDAAGGSEDEIAVDDAPMDLGVAICRVAKISESLSDKIQKTPRQVISAAVIADANVLLALIRIVRRLTRQV
jgi:hypothetical protein